MKKKSLGLNAILSGVKSIMSIVFALISFPYVSRMIQVDNLGKYDFSNSFNSYFILIAALGISTYAIREGAKYRDSREEISSFASEIFSINCVSTVVAYLLLFVIIIFVPKLHNYWILISIFSIEIFFKTLGVEWMYSIFEEYTYITVRSIIFQILSLILMFLFIKGKDDYYIYAGITVFANAGSNLLNFIHLKKYCDLKITKNVDWKRHLKPILIIFATSVATTIYVNSDTTILGFMTSDYHVGLYAVSVKVYKIVKTFLSAILIVSIPRLSNYLGTKQIEKYNNSFSNIFNVLVVLVVPAVVGLFFLSNEIVLVLSDKSYLPAGMSLKILSLALLVCLFGWLFNSCVLIPYKKEKQVLIATCVSAALNVSLNFILIPFGKQNATALTTCIAELCSLIMCVYYSKGLVRLKFSVKDGLSVIVGCTVIALTCSFLRLMKMPCVTLIVTSIILSVALYAITLLCFRNSVLIGYLHSVIRRKK